MKVYVLRHVWGEYTEAVSEDIADIYVSKDKALTEAKNRGIQILEDEMNRCKERGSDAMGPLDDLVAEYEEKLENLKNEDLGIRKTYGSDDGLFFDVYQVIERELIE